MLHRNAGAMTRDDYDERRKRMDEELRAGIELLQAAHAAQVRALDLVWMSSEPTRGSLVRVLQELLAEKLFAVEVRGEGTIPTKYRKL